MLETINWKAEKIGDYRALSAIVVKCEDELIKDPELNALKYKRATIETEINRCSRNRKMTIEEAKQEQQMIKMELQDHWDIDGKTYNCSLGSASLRTKKTLEINDQHSLLIWLFKLERLESAIRTLDTVYLKRLKDADMIPDDLAYYVTKTNVAITETK